MAVEGEPQRTIPFWAFKVIAAMYFIRCIMTLSYLAMSLGSISSETYILFPLIFLSFIFVEMLGGFIFLTRRFSDTRLALFYVVTGILSPYPIFDSIRYFVFFLPRIHIYTYFQPHIFFELIIGASYLMELALFLLLGLIWVNEKRVGSHD